MKSITIDISKKAFEELKSQFEKDYDEISDEDKGKGYRMEFDNLEVEGSDLDDGSLNLYGGIKGVEDGWFSIWIGSDAYTLGKCVEYVAKSLNRFKSALESISAI